jgi:hypothetical protein
MFGVDVDFVARTHCSVALITVEDIQVRGSWVTFFYLKPTLPEKLRI